MTNNRLQVAVIVASVRDGRGADAILHWLTDELAQRPDIEIDLVDLRVHHDDLVAAPVVPGGASTEIAERLSAAEAFVILTPEYNHSFPAALKHVIDLHFDEWAYKPVSFVSYGAMSGGIRAVEHLRQIFPELRSTTTRSAVILRMPWARTDPDTGRFHADDAESSALHATLDELRWWGLTLRSGRERHPLPA